MDWAVPAASHFSNRGYILTVAGIVLCAAAVTAASAELDQKCAMSVLRVGDVLRMFDVLRSFGVHDGSSNADRLICGSWPPLCAAP